MIVSIEPSTGPAHGVQTRPRVVPKKNPPTLPTGSLIRLSIRVANDAAGLRNEPFERSRPKHEQPEANKDGNRQGAKQVLIDSKYLSHRAENDRHA